MPRFFQIVRNIRDVCTGVIPDEAIVELATLKKELYQLNEKVETFLRGSDLVFEYDTEHEELGLPTSYLFKDIRLGEALCVFCRTVILVTRGRFQLGLAGPDDRYMARVAAARLCMTAENARKLAPFGCLFASLNPRVARYACSDVLATWIDQELPQIDAQLDDSFIRMVGFFDLATDIESPSWEASPSDDFVDLTPFGIT